MNKTKLKPCPFCGSKGTIVSDFGKIKFCMCKNCLSATDTKRTEEEAIEAWNRRVSDED